MSLLVPDCLTAREIAQQPSVWVETDALALGLREALAERAGRLLRRSDARVVLAGAGSSGFVGRILAPALAAHGRRRIDAVPTTDIVADPRGVFAEDLPTVLVSFARSGDSPESLAAATLADQLLGECAHVAITCNSAGALAAAQRDRPDALLLALPQATNDRGFAMTSSFTAMLLAARALLGGTDRFPVGAIAEAAGAVLAERPEAAKRLAERGFDRLVALGSGALRGLADEAALKVLELTAGGVTALSDSALGFRHGPKSILDERTLVLLFVSNDPATRPYDLDIGRELAAALPPGRVVAIAGRPDGLDPEGTWLLPGLERADDVALAAVGAVCAQLVALHASVARGCTPDDPFPAREVSRVVRGVTVHPLPPLA